MRRLLRRVAGVLLALAVLVAVGALTRFSYPVTSPHEAELRLAWRARVPLVEECRRLSEAEQAEQPAHMRRDVVCEGRVASYRLEVVVDGEVRKATTVSGAGARGDRPVYVFESIPLTPGRHEVMVLFERIGQAAAGGQTSRIGAETVPDRMRLQTSVQVPRRGVVLVSYDPAVRDLTLR